MNIDIYDVGHGGCAIVTCPNGARMMIDCGLRLDPGWFPSITFCQQWIDLLVFNNLDEDHLEDLPYVWRDVPLGAISTNPTVDAPALAAMKREHGMGDGVHQAYTILRLFGPGLIGKPPNFGDVGVWAYYNRYGLDFEDTNNLSLAVFVSYGTFTILFAGDLETAGWHALLRSPAFQADLTTVTVFVASHHGRANGCSNEVFRFCHPEVFVISDDERQFNSQNTDDWYRVRAKGIPDLLWLRGDRRFGLPSRYVLTTRRDGSLRLRVTKNGRYLVTPHTVLAQSHMARTPALLDAV